MEVSGRKEFDKQTTNKDEQARIYCQPCRGDGESITAAGYCETCNEYLCFLCLKVHRKLAATKNHVIKTGDEMLRVQVQADPIFELCDTHKTEIVKFYCHDHDMVGCGDCIVLDHKTCSVNLVPDVSNNYGNNEELVQLKNKIEELKNEVTSFQTGIDTNLKSTDEMKIKVKQEIEQFRKKVNEYLDKAEADLIDKLDKFTAEHVKEYEKQKVNFESIENEIKETQDKLEQCSDKTNQLFIMGKLAKKKLRTCQELMESIILELETNTIKFDPSEELSTLRETNLPLGKVAVHSQKFNMRNEKSAISWTADLADKLNVQIEHDGQCAVTGMVKISSFEIVLADCKNYSIKLFDLTKNAVTSVYKPGYFPWDITVIDSNNVAATLPNPGKIVFLNTKNGLTKSHSVKVKQWCYGIDYKNGLFAVTFLEHTPQILNIKGEVLHEFRDISFGSLTYIVFSNDSKTVFTSDHWQHLVYEITVDGQLKTTIKCDDFNHTRGLAVTTDGSVMVCSENAKDTVSIIMPGSHEVQPLVVKNVQKPFSILLSEDQKKLFIGEYKDSSDSYFIKVFDLK